MKARQNNIRVVVKSTGHDYQGRSQAPEALSIWVHHMQNREMHGSFRPKGCNFTIDSTAVTVGGGSQIGALVHELDTINQTIVGGTSKSVSVGGYITGGGHSVLAQRYGMGADQVLELEVVTPIGEIVTANECQNEDLFWAMRGVSWTARVRWSRSQLMKSSGRWLYLWCHDICYISHTSNTENSGSRYRHC